MKTQKDWDRFYMQMAHQVSELSYDPKTKVGAVLLLNEAVMFSYNGTLRRSSNDMRDEEGETLEVVNHAEASVLMKATRSSLSTCFGTMYITRAPCLQCAKLIALANIWRVVYDKEHSCDKGLMYLRQYTSINLHKYEY